MMGKNTVREGLSLLSEFHIDADDCDTAPLELEYKNEDCQPRSTVFKVTLSYFKRLVGQSLSVILSILGTFVPSFIPRSSLSSRDTPSDRRLSPTAYLDGLRGVAAFVVLIVHFVVNWFPGLNHTYGATPEDHYFFQLPIVRALLGGKGAVAVFFVISGYALSYRALSKINSGNKTDVLDTLSSSTFRRCLRLHMPCAVNTFICMLLSYNGMFTKDPLAWNAIPPQLPTFTKQFWNWWSHQQVLMYPFLFVEGDPYSPPYNGHLWTIPFEIRGSFVVYGTILAVAKLTSFWRIVVLLAWDAYLWYMGKWDLFLFVSGIILANMDVPRHIAGIKDGLDHIPPEDICLPTSDPPMIRMTIQNPNNKSIWTRTLESRSSSLIQLKKFVNGTWNIFRSSSPFALFLVGMYLLSFPHVTYGYKFLRSLAPEHFEELSDFFSKKGHAIRCLGAVILALSLSFSPPSSLSTRTTPQQRPAALPRLFKYLSTINLQSLFTNSFAQYLGRISFGLYLMHGPVLFCMGTKFLVPAWRIYFDVNHDLGAYVRTFALAAVCNFIAVFWVADVFTRVVDERSVRWAASLAKFMSRKAKAVSGTGS